MEAPKLAEPVVLEFGRARAKGYGLASGMLGFMAGIPFGGQLGLKRDLLVIFGVGIGLVAGLAISGLVFYLRGNWRTTFDRSGISEFAGEDLVWHVPWSAIEQIGRGPTGRSFIRQVGGTRHPVNLEGTLPRKNRCDLRVLKEAIGPVVVGRKPVPKKALGIACGVCTVAAGAMTLLIAPVLGKVRDAYPNLTPFDWIVLCLGLPVLAILLVGLEVSGAWLASTYKPKPDAYHLRFRETDGPLEPVILEEGQAYRYVEMRSAKEERTTMLVLAVFLFALGTMPVIAFSFPRLPDQEVAMVSIIVLCYGGAVGSFLAMKRWNYWLARSGDRFVLTRGNLIVMSGGYERTFPYNPSPNRPIGEKPTHLGIWHEEFRTPAEIYRMDRRYLVPENSGERPIG